MAKYKTIFSYYGGKSKIVHLYPKPKHDTIVEPFAGAAPYALLYYDRDIVLNDLDPKTYSIWDFLTSDIAFDYVNEHFPSDIKKGMIVDDLVPDGCPPGFLELLRSSANQGTQGARGVHRQVTSMALTCWGRVEPKLLHFIPKIKHWVVLSCDYSELPDLEATWFVDPPYDNAAGKRYRTNDVDYVDLALWCASRDGQVIVCENEGAVWLPFTHLTKRAGVYSRYQKSTANEVIWTSDMD